MYVFFCFISSESGYFKIYFLEFLFILFIGKIRCSYNLAWMLFLLENLKDYMHDFQSLPDQEEFNR